MRRSNRHLYSSKEITKDIEEIQDVIPKLLRYYRYPRYLLPVLRDLRQVSQRELAARSGVSPNQIALIEKGRSDPRINTLGRLFKALHFDLVIIPRPIRSLSVNDRRTGV